MRAAQDPLTSGLHLARTILRNPTLKAGVATYITLHKKNRIDVESLIKDPSRYDKTTPTFVSKKQGC